MSPEPRRLRFGLLDIVLLIIIIGVIEGILR